MTLHNILHVTFLFIAVQQSPAQHDTFHSTVVVLWGGITDMVLWHDILASLGTHAVKLESTETFLSAHAVKVPSSSSVVQPYVCYGDILMKSYK